MSVLKVFSKVFSYAFLEQIFLGESMGKVTSVKKEHCRMRFPGSFLKYLEI